MALVSIIIPTFNRERLLPEAIDSVLSQTHPDVECVVVDDGSTDGTGRVLDGYGDRIVVDRQQNLGQAAAVNRGFALSHGDLSSVLASDDTLAPGAVAACVEVLSARPEVVAVHGIVEIVDELGIPMSRYTVGDMQLPELLRYATGPSSTGILYRTRHAIDVGGWNPAFRYGGDYEFLLRLGLMGSFAYLETVVGTWRHHSGSISVARADPARNAREYVEIVSGFLHRCDLPPSVDAAVRAEALRAAYYTAGIVAGSPVIRADTRFTIADRIAPRISTQVATGSPVAIANAQACAPTRLEFSRGWADYGAPYTAGCFYRDPAGIVHLEGLVRRTEGDEAIITILPRGFRPSGIQLFHQVGGGDGGARVDVDGYGAVSLVAGDASYVSLAGIAFLAREPSTEP